MQSYNQPVRIQNGVEVKRKALGIVDKDGQHLITIHGTIAVRQTIADFQ